MENVVFIEKKVPDYKTGMIKKLRKQDYVETTVTVELNIYVAEADETQVVLTTMHIFRKLVFKGV